MKDNTIKLARKLIAHVNYLINKQLTLVFENKSFKDMITSWSCLYYLTNISKKDYVIIKILDLKWQEIPSLAININRLDSPLSQKVLHEFDLPGNDPLSLIIGNYLFDISNKQDVETLSCFGEIGAYVFAPFISSITHHAFGAEELSFITKINLDNIAKSQKFRYISDIAKNNYANFIGLVIPRIFFPSLIKVSYPSDYCPLLGSNISNYKTVLGNGAFIFAAFAIKSFIDTGWFLSITGKTTSILKQESINNKFSIYTKYFFENAFEDSSFIFFKYITEFLISENKEKEIADLGFIPLCHVKNKDFATLYSANSLRTLDITFSQPLKITYSIQYILCISRFAHYIKVIGRQKLGLFSNASEFEDLLNKWILQYISSDIQTPLNLKHKYPLLDAKIEVNNDLLLKDHYNCNIYLKPHLIPTQLSADIVLKTKIINS